MTTNFTLRDFFVYLLTGLTMIISVGVIFFNEIFTFTVTQLDQYQFIKEFAFLVTIFLIPIIYLLGHIIGSLSYQSLKLFLIIDKLIKKKGGDLPKWKYKTLIFFQMIFYRQRIVYAAITHKKPKSEEKTFKDINEFWTSCAKLQIQKIYGPAEYWNLLNELFNSLNLIFFISTTISVFTRQWTLVIVFCVLTIFAFKRARQYAEFCINTVSRLTIAAKSIEQKK